MRVKHASSLNTSEPRVRKAQLTSRDQEDRLGEWPKQYKMSDAVSAIEDGDNSELFDRELIEDFRQFGIETVFAQEQYGPSQDHILERGAREDRLGKTHTNDRKSEDNIIDFSYMARMKKHDFTYQENHFKIINALKKLQALSDNVRENLSLVAIRKVQIGKQIQNLRTQCQSMCRRISIIAGQKINEANKTLEQAQQQHRNQIREHRDKAQELHQDNLNLRQDIKKLTHKLKAMEQNARNLSLKGSSASTFNRQVDLLSINSKRNDQLSTNYERQSNALKMLSQEVKQLTAQSEQLRKQNKNLKKQLQQTQRKLVQANGHKISRNFVQYQNFLFKIQTLEKQVQSLRSCQKKGVNIINAEMQSQLAEIDQFLEICDRKEHELVNRQKQLAIRERQLTSRIQSLNLGDYDYGPDLNQPGSGYRLRNLATPRKNTIALNQEYLSERMIRLNKSCSPNQFTKYRPPNHKHEERTTAHTMSSHCRSPAKHSEQINGRIARIQSSLASELHSLAHRI